MFIPYKQKVVAFNSKRGVVTTRLRRIRGRHCIFFYRVMSAQSWKMLLDYEASIYCSLLSASSVDS